MRAARLMLVAGWLKSLLLASASKSRCAGTASDDSQCHVTSANQPDSSETAALVQSRLNLKGRISAKGHLAKLVKPHLQKFVDDNTKFVSGVPVFRYNLVHNGEMKPSLLELKEPKDWIVEFEDTCTDDGLKKFCSDLPGEAHCKEVGHPSKHGLAFVELLATEEELKTLIDREGLCAIDFTEPNTRVDAIPEVASDGSSLLQTQGVTWGIDRIDARSGLDGQYAYSDAGSGVTVYVADTGIRCSHQEFEGGRCTYGADWTIGDGMQECTGGAASLEETDMKKSRQYLSRRYLGGSGGSGGDGGGSGGDGDDGDDDGGSGGDGDDGGGDGGDGGDGGGSGGDGGGSGGDGDDGDDDGGSGGDGDDGGGDGGDGGDGGGSGGDGGGSGGDGDDGDDDGGSGGDGGDDGGDGGDGGDGEDSGGDGGGSGGDGGDGGGSGGDGSDGGGDGGGGSGGDGGGSGGGGGGGGSSTPCGHDKQGHGTHCAGTVAGKTMGVARQAKVVALKVLGDDGSGTIAGTIGSIDYVMSKSGPRIWSASLGGPGADVASQTAIDKAVAAGVIVSVAAGNDSKDACSDSPAFVPSAITVAASGKSDEAAGFSNYGTCVDIYAPGVDITSAGVNSDSVTDTHSGTSMACPHVSGAAAFILGENPSLTPSQVLEILLQFSTSDKITGNKVGTPNKLLYVEKGMGGSR